MYKELKEWEKKYAEEGLKTIGMIIKQKFHEGEKKWKKDFKFATQSWKQGTEIQKRHNAIALICGKETGIFVVDVDQTDKWREFLNDIGQKEPVTVKAKSANGGIHYYFKYTDNLDGIGNRVKAITHNGENLEVDVRTNDGFIICPPSKYFNENVKKETEYEWIYGITTHQMSEVPDWLYELLVKKSPIQKKKKEQIIEINKKNDEETILPIEKDEQQDENNIESKELEQLLDMLSLDRCTNRKKWIDVGILLYNLGSQYYTLWEKWSRKCKDKFDKKDCIKTWNSFEPDRCEKCKHKTDPCKICKKIRCPKCVDKKDKCKNCKGKTLGIGTLIKWVKEDDPKKYEEYIRAKNLMKIIERNKTKFPDSELAVSKVVFNNHQSYAELSDKFCPIIKKNHNDDSTRFLLFTAMGWCMYCTSKDCRGKTIPYNDFIKYARNDIKIICINNNYYGDPDKKEADIDIPADYDIFEDAKLNQLIYDSLNTKTYGIGELILYLYKDRYRCTEDGIWYEFKDHRWKCNAQAQSLSLTLSRDLINYYKRMKTYYSKIKGKSLEEHTNIQVVMKRITKIIDDLTSITSKSLIISEAKNLFYEHDEGFINKLDTKSDIIAFNNGVFDFSIMEFRDGKPEDYISINVGYDYDSTKQSDELKDMIEKTLPIEDVRKYTLKLFAICLNGDIKLQKIHFLNGNGSNGKSLIMKLLSVTFGPYISNMPTSMITNKRAQAENATPQLFKTKEKRIIYFSEPNKNDVLNIGLLKEWSGTDTLTARALNKAPIEFIPQFKMFVISNKLPKIDADDSDYATWRRIRNIRFISRFIDGEPNPEIEYEFQKDPTLENKIAGWKMEFFNLLIEYYKLYQEEGLKEPIEITKYTDAYKKEDDYYGKFSTDYIKKTQNPADYIVWTELKDCFQTWYRDNYSEKVPNVKDIKKWFEEQYFGENEKLRKTTIMENGKANKIVFRGWIGYRLKTDEEIIEVENNDNSKDLD